MKLGKYDKVKDILWKYDDELGIAYFCPMCKKFLCGNENKCSCGQKINWSSPKKSNSKIQWI
ncbi:hypothetical protein [Clostridium butyricum]|uniref:hypothetical protein n=1 Tax=Clostridium butyricum TaxID=1492 RepID=UPI00374EFFB4